MNEIESLGASLIVLSPQLPDFTRKGAEAQKLNFPILTDHDNRVGDSLGLAFRLPDDLIEVRASARSFLHNQVRSMVGCLVLVGMGRWREEQVAEALAARDRQALGLNAPSDGLYFVRALYPDE